VDLVPPTNISHANFGAAIAARAACTARASFGASWLVNVAQPQISAVEPIECSATITWSVFDDRRRLGAIVILLNRT
jgi:hypothetical protein